MYQRAWTSSSGRHTGPKPIVDSCDRLRLYHSLAIAECESQLVGHSNCVTQTVRIATLPVHLADHQIEPNSETLNPGPQLFIFISCIMCIRYVIYSDAIRSFGLIKLRPFQRRTLCIPRWSHWLTFSEKWFLPCFLLLSLSSEKAHIDFSNDWTKM